MGFDNGPTRGHARSRMALPAFVFVLLSATGCSGSATSDDGDASSEGADGTPVVCQVPPPVVESFPAVTTQAQLDELAGCEEVSGKLLIDAPDGVDLDLSPLASLRRVRGELVIGCNPYVGTDSYCGPSVERSLTLDGLESLESVASLTLGGLRVTSLAPLGNLRSIDNQLNIVNCGSLTSLEGLEGALLSTVSLQQNVQLSSLSGLTLAADAERVHIQGAPALTDLSALSPLESVSHLELREMPLRHLNMLSQLTSVDSLYLIQVPELNDLSGLSQIRTVARLYLDETGLENLDELPLESIAELDLSHNAALVEVDSLGTLLRLSRLSVIGNDRLLRLPAFPNLTAIDWVDLEFNTALVEGPRFPNVEHMSSGTIAIANNPALLEIDGFANIDQAAAIEIRQNVQLARVNFGRLRTAGTLRITCNLELPDSSLAPLLDVEVPSGERQLDGNQGSEALCQRL
jgi:hypothetical protein